MSTVAKLGHDDIDNKIDNALDRVGMFVGFWLRIFIVLGIIGGLIWLVVGSPWSAALKDPVSLALQMGAQIAFAIVFVIVQFAAIFWFLGRSRVYWILPGETGISFADYRGNPEILEVARRVVTLLKGVRHFKDMGGEVHRGLLLIGPPGTGKSYLAQCIATEAGVPFCYASAPSFQAMFFGISNLKVMMLFGKARKMARKYGACIVFIDEIDAIGGGRAQGGGIGAMMGGGSGLLNELLMQMDPPRLDDGWRNRLFRKMGLRAKGAERPAVLTMGATNIPQVLDAALLRPGRFDWKIQIDAPDVDGRKEVIEYYLAKVAHDPKLSLERLAQETIHYTPAALKYLINEAVVIAHFDGRDAMEYKDFVLAMEMYETGIRQPIKSMSLEERTRIAYHETGHAIALAKLLPKERIQQVTIVRHGDALGFMMPKPLQESYGKSLDELLGDIQVSLAGKAAEQVYLHDEFTGATSDLIKATRTAGAIVGNFGMGGSLYAIGSLNDGPDAKLKREVERILDDEFKKVKHLLAEYRGAADEIVRRLVERGDLLGDEVIEIIADYEKTRGNGHLNGNGNGHYLPEPNGNGHHSVLAEPTVQSLSPATATTQASESTQATATEGQWREIGSPLTPPASDQPSGTETN
ncbi:MAG: AAA family ATPase [Chloroflexi bacterium]|nr:AAA family ATPase [Chloroflexota bacterium]